MGSSKTSSSSQSEQTQQTTFAPASQQELALRQQFMGLGNQQQATIEQLLAKAQSGQALNLSPDDQARLDQAYNSARMQFDLGAKDYADTLAGGRGMRMSDTPISQQALQRYGLGKAELESQRAMAGLNLGLQANQYLSNLGLAAAGATPAGSAGIYSDLFNERMRGGLTKMTGSQQSSGTAVPSLMSQIQQGMKIAGGVGSLGLGMMSGMGGLGLGGGASSGLSGVMPGAGAGGFV